MEKEIIKILSDHLSNGVFPDESETELIYKEDFEFLALELKDFFVLNGVSGSLKERRETDFEKWITLNCTRWCGGEVDYKGKRYGGFEIRKIYKDLAKNRL